MNDTSEADVYLDSVFDIYNSGPDKEWRIIKRGFFLLAAVTVLMVSAVALQRVRPNMNTYDGTMFLGSLLMVGFFFVLIMLAFVIHQLKQVRRWMEDLKEAIEWLDQKTAAARYDTPDDDIFSGD